MSLSHNLTMTECTPECGQHSALHGEDSSNHTSPQHNWFCIQSPSDNYGDAYDGIVNQTELQISSNE